MSDETSREIVLKINGKEFPNTLKGTYTLAPISTYNEYECEDGSSTVEEIQTGYYEGSVVYKALLQEDVYDLYRRLTLVSDVAILDPTTERRRYMNMTCIIDGKKLPYVFNDDDISVWGMSFKFRQIAPGHYENEIEGVEEVIGNA